MEYSSAIKKKNKIFPFVATCMDLENIILSEASQTEKHKYYAIITYTWILKITQMNLYTKQKQTHRHKKQIYGYQRGEGGKLGVWN